MWPLLYEKTWIFDNSFIFLLFITFYLFSFSILWNILCHREFLTNELRVASYELLFTYYIQVTGFYLFYQLRVTFYMQITSYYVCISCELIIAYDLRVTIYCTSYKLTFICELRVSIYCTS